jgi:hypothetical protein
MEDELVAQMLVHGDAGDDGSNDGGNGDDDGGDSDDCGSE